MISSKICYTCKIQKPLSEFYTRKDSPCGYRGVCKCCILSQQTKYFNKQYHINYRKRNRLIHNAKQKIRQRKQNNYIEPQAQFLIKANKIHGDKYDYSNVIYTNSSSKVDIACRTHGVFSQIANDHIQGSGCPKCVYSKFSVGESLIVNFLDKYKIDYNYDKTFDDFRNPLTNYSYFFDFYLPSINTCIEFDGKQHYIAQPLFGGDEGLMITQQRDKLKTDYCINNKINLIRIPYTEINNIENILLESLSHIIK